MPKYKLIKGIPKEKLLVLLPKSLVHFVDISAITEPLITVAIFSSDRKKVILLGQVKPLIDKIQSLKPIVVVGSTFTQDASALLRKNTTYFYCFDETFWTDKSYIDNQVSISRKSRV